MVSHRLVFLPLLLAIMLFQPKACEARDSLASAREDWIELRTQYFTLYSHAGERKTREIATSFERLREILQRLRPDAEHLLEQIETIR